MMSYGGKGGISVLYYQPEQGVFIVLDPDPGNADDPITMNGYNYADNNPVMKIDPDGNAAVAAYWGVAKVTSAFIPGVGWVFIGGVAVYSIYRTIRRYCSNRRVNNFSKDSERYTKKQKTNPPAEHRKGKSTNNKHTKRPPGGKEKRKIIVGKGENNEI